MTKGSDCDTLELVGNKPHTTTREKIMRHKGTVASAEVIYSPALEYGVRTEWAVCLHIQSPTGDSSDFLWRELPCVSREQAVIIADKWNSEVCPELVGKFEPAIPAQWGNRPVISMRQ